MNTIIFCIIEDSINIYLVTRNRKVKFIYCESSVEAMIEQGLV